MHRLYIVCRMQGEYGPFNPSMATQVPLWLAVNLRKRQKCRIEPPHWLNVGGLWVYGVRLPPHTHILILLNFDIFCQIHPLNSTPTLATIISATLSATKTAEKDSSVFTKMPSEHYMEVASLLLNK